MIFHEGFRVAVFLEFLRRVIRQAGRKVYLDEMLNNDVKSNAVGRKRAKDRPQLIRNVHGYLRSRQKTPAMVRRYFHAKTVRYAA
jgi:hypothetical protein